MHQSSREIESKETLQWWIRRAYVFLETVVEVTQARRAECIGRLWQRKRNFPRFMIRIHKEGESCARYTAACSPPFVGRTHAAEANSARYQ